MHFLLIKMVSCALFIHAHKDKKNIHPRAMYIGDVYFKKVRGVDRLRISKERIVPRISRTGSNQ